MAVLQNTTITGGLTMNGMSAGFMKISPTGIVTVDTNAYLTAITSGQITGALGYTPYNSSNPNGYITSSSLSSYLPLSGGTVTGDVTFGNNSVSDQGIRINYGNYVSGYGRIRFMQDGNIHSTIHSFSASWQNGSLAGHSTGAINLDGQNGVTIGAWNNASVWIDNGGVAQARSSFRAPIFYDSDDTTYYADFNSTSNSAIRVRGGMLMGPNPTWGAYLQVGGNGSTNSSAASVVTTNGNLHLDSATGLGTYINHYYGGRIYFGSGGNEGGTYTHSTFSAAGNLYLGGGGTDASHRLHVNGTGYATSDFRAPIFYDSNDTGYYGDFASISSMYGIAIRGDSSSVDTSNQIFFWGNGNSTTSAIGFKANGGSFGNPTGFGDGYNTYFTMDEDGRGWVFRRGVGGSNFSAAYTAGWILNNGIAQFNASVRAPIFYDSNDTSFYLDPNSTGLSLSSNGVVSSGGGTSGGFQNRIYVAGRNRIWSFGNADAYGISYFQGPDYIGLHFGTATQAASQFWVSDSGIAQASGSMRAPIFYDSNDTSFYLDPNGTSNLNTWTSETSSRIGRPAYWTNRYSKTTNLSHSTGTNGWGVEEGTWANAWKGGFSGWDIWGTSTDHPQGSGYVHAQGIISGLHHANTSTGANAYGWMMVGAHNAVENRYWLRGKWDNSTSGWVEMITTGNIGSQSVNYAANSGALGGYSGSNFLGKNGNSYYQQDTWIQINGVHGLYAPSYNGAHWLPNTASSYTTWRMSGSRNGYSGIHDDYSNVQMLMFDSAGNGGTYREANGRWYWYYHLGNASMGINSSTTSSSYALYVNGAIYATGDVVAYSDKRKKKNIETIENALEKVTSLRGVFYDKIGEEDKGRQLGVIAQEVDKVLPEAVNYASDVDEYGVKYGNMVGLLIEAMKEQQQQIEDLKLKLDAVTK